MQSYPWRVSQHIVVLEFAAFFNYVRKQVRNVRFHGSRFFNIFDSRIIACVVATGRSSSSLRNRAPRRYAAVALAADLYVLTVWTISQWMHADAGSRRHPGNDWLCFEARSRFAGRASSTRAFSQIPYTGTG